MKGDESRLCRKVIESQKKRNIKGWYSEVEDELKNIGIDPEKVERYGKGEWKREVKEKLKKKIERKCKVQEGKMKKLRFIGRQRYERQEYIKKGKGKSIMEMIRTKLDMWNIGKSLGGEKECTFCKEEEETLEHISKMQRTQKYNKLERH